MTLTSTLSCRASADPLVEQRLDTIEYTAAWDQQRAHAAARAEGTGPDVLMLLEHPSVYTAGRRTREWEKPLDGTPVVDVDRGGKITWHGPGQLVGYPIVKLADPIDVLEYVRRLEEALITVCAGYGLTGYRVNGRTGVWLAAESSAGGTSLGTDRLRIERKIAAIGVRVQRGVTLHGFSFNCNPDMGEWNRIVPCGITDAGVTSLTAELGRPVEVADVIDRTAAAVTDALDGRLPVTDHTLR